MVPEYGLLPSLKGPEASAGYVRGMWDFPSLGPTVRLTHAVTLHTESHP